MNGAPTTVDIAAGFGDPVHDAQTTFRLLMMALAEPGTITSLAAAPPAAAALGLPPAAVAILLTLADFDTPLWLPQALATGPAAHYLRFHTGAAMTDAPAAARFAVLDGDAERPPLAAFAPGSDRYPDTSATLLIGCPDLRGAPRLHLSGPGIDGVRTLADCGLPPSFWREVADNHQRYPLGVDLVLVSGRDIVGLPRTTAVEMR